MSGAGVYIANQLWRLASLPAARRMHRALRDPVATQRQRLMTFLRSNAESAYGRKHQYGAIRSVEEFQQRVPVVSYEDLQPWVERIASGEPHVLTSEPVQMMEPTSGSTTARKLIPYTASLRREFQAAVGAWMVDLYRRYPALLSGRQYWSISPAARQREFTQGGLPIGFENDVEYLSRVEQAIVQRVICKPPGVEGVTDIDEHRRLTMQHLAAQRDLKLLSVWSPVFLTQLLKFAPPGFAPEKNWPQLEVISCWTDGASAGFARELQQLFPGVAIQGKGLLATEGVVSIPLHGHAAPVAALTSHFLEFLDQQQRPWLAGQLKPGELYQPLITCGNGFARYRLGDVVRAAGPCSFEFIGRGEGTSDLCGEKLSEAFIATVFAKLQDDFRNAMFMTLAPRCDTMRRGYVLILDKSPVSGALEKLEAALRESVHYNYCRQLGQLEAVQLMVAPDAAARHFSVELQRGVMAGDIKPRLLQTRSEWLEAFIAAKFSDHHPAVEQL